MEGELAVSDDPVTWLRATIEGDKRAALIISDGGFAPQHWDTDPPGIVNPVSDPASLAVSEAIGQEPEYSSGWVQIAVYEREIGDAPEEEYREPGAVAAIADIGRRQFDHIRRHDPRDTVARCDAELAILDICERVIREDKDRLCDDDDPRWSGLAVARVTVSFLASGYRHRAGYLEKWKP